MHAVSAMDKEFAEKHRLDELDVTGEGVRVQVPVGDRLVQASIELCRRRDALQLRQIAIALLLES